MSEAMGGLERIRAVKNQVIISEGDYFEPQQALTPSGQPRHVSHFRAETTRELGSGRLREDWGAEIFYVFKAHVRYVRIVNGGFGLVESRDDRPVQQFRMDLGQLATRVREERRAQPQIVLTALEHEDIRVLPDVRVAGKKQHVLSFQEKGQEFQLFIDAHSKLLTQVDILEDDPTYGDSRYRSRYSDWREVNGVKIPFGLRYEINGDLLRTERYLSVLHNEALASTTFDIPQAIRDQKPYGESVASEWLLRRLAMNVDYPPSLTSRPSVKLTRLSDGVFYTKDGIYNSFVIELRDYLIVIEPVLYEANSVQVIAAIKARFPGKAIRFIVPTHSHNDHSGGIRTYIAEGATILAPAISRAHYQWVASNMHTLRPDRLQATPRRFCMKVVDRHLELRDGLRRVEIFVLPTTHARDLQLIYLPQEKLLIEADLMSPSDGEIGQPIELARQLLLGIRRLNLKVVRIAGVHGDVGTFRQLVEGVHRKT